MKFNLDMLKNHLFIQQGIPPERVNLETNFKVDLSMSDNQIRKMLGFVQGQTGIIFPNDATFYLTDVFDLMIHLMIRAVEVEISDEYFNSRSEPVWQNFLRTKFMFPVYAQLNE
jgi:hypothetical protein